MRGVDEVIFQTLVMSPNMRSSAWLASRLSVCGQYASEWPPDLPTANGGVNLTVNRVPWPSSPGAISSAPPIYLTRVAMIFIPKPLL
jgi:hypothetical protein